MACPCFAHCCRCPCVCLAGSPMGSFLQLHTLQAHSNPAHVSHACSTLMACAEGMTRRHLPAGRWLQLLLLLLLLLLRLCGATRAPGGRYGNSMAVVMYVSDTELAGCCRRRIETCCRCVDDRPVDGCRLAVVLSWHILPVAVRVQISGWNVALLFACSAVCV